MSKHDDDTCPHLVRASLLEAENARLKAEVGELADALKLASEVGIKIADEVTRLKAEVERLRALSENSEWQPIETAPKDMTRVLGYVEESVVVMWWFSYSSHDYGCWETVDGESEVDPTHWMPLPKPPAKEGKPSV